MTDRTDISDLTRPLCERLGLEPAHVASIVITPHEAIAEVYLLDESGSKYIREDTQTAALEFRKFSVQA